MNALTTMWTVMLKELRDIGRDRRTLALTLFLSPLLFPVLILGMGTLTEKRMRTQIEKTLEVPTIGIGCGEGTCDGEIAVVTDLLGSFPWFVPPFARPEADVAGATRNAVAAYIQRVSGGEK